MSGVNLEYTLQGLIDHFRFIHNDMPNLKFAWVLGAGASHPSGIPLGSDLVDEWLEEMYRGEVHGKTSLRSWATAEQLQIRNFDYENRASFYTEIYQRRFQKCVEEGYACLEKKMANREPSPGYSILATALATTRHDVVITTNFDNLIADALAIYTSTFPLIIGHESLTGFINVSNRHPVICKIHRDLLFEPQNDRRHLKRLNDSWGMALRALFGQFIPLVIGYGGNDDTLMGWLESLEPGDIRAPLIWCYYERDQPSKRIRELVSTHNGYLVAVPDFDLLMFLLGQEMGIRTLDAEIDKRAAHRRRRYRDRIIQLDLSGNTLAAEAVAATMKGSGGWWREYQQTQTETDPEKRRKAFEHAIQTEDGKDSAVLWGLYANFMRDEIRNFKVADDSYVKARELDPDDATITGDHALLMAKWRKYNEAQELFERALRLDPSNAIVTNRLANFLWYVQDEPESAEELYRKAAQLDPKNIAIALDLAVFVWNYVGSLIQAGAAYRVALKLDPQRVRTLTSYAGFLLSIEQYDDALRTIDKANLLNAGKEKQLAAVLAFYEAIILRARQRDNATPLYRLNDLLNNEFRRERWRFDRVLDLLKKSIPDRAKFFTGLAERIMKPGLQPGVEPEVPAPSSVAAPSPDELNNVFERWDKPMAAGSSRPPSS